MTEMPQIDSYAPVAVKGGVVTYLSLDGAIRASEFYQKAFGAEIAGMLPPDEQGRTCHLHLYINGSSVMLADPFPEHGCGLEKPQGFNLTLMVDDIESAFARRRGRSGSRHAGREDVLGRYLCPAPRSVRRHLGHERAGVIDRAREEPCDGARRAPSRSSVLETQHDRTTPAGPKP